MTRTIYHVSNLNKRFSQTSIFINYWKPTYKIKLQTLVCLSLIIESTKHDIFAETGKERMPNTIEIRNSRVVHLLYLNFHAQCVYIRIYIYFAREKWCSTLKQGFNDLCFRLVSNGIRTRIVNHEQDVWPWSFNISKSCPSANRIYVN